MKATRILILISLFFSPFAYTKAYAQEGLISIESPHSVAQTAERLVNAVNDKGLTLFAQIDHASNAENAGLALQASTVIVFGNPKVGTPLMRCQPSVAIDLPQKVLIWKNPEGQVWLSYNDPQYLKARHKIDGCDETLAKVAGVLAGLSGAATQP